MSKHNDDVYLKHILESIQKIEDFLGDHSFNDFENDIKTSESGMGYDKRRYPQT